MEEPSDLTNVIAVPSEEALSMEIAAADQLQDLGKRTLLAYEHDNENGLMMVVPAFVARSLQAHGVVPLLVRLGHDAEAYGVMRTVTELSIDLGCIARDTTGTQLDEFVAYSHMKEKRSLDALSSAARVHHDPGRARELKSFIGTETNAEKPPWESSVEARARKSGRQGFVVTAYAIGSNAIHPCVGCLGYAYRFLPGDRLQWFPGPRRRDARAIYWANVMFALTLVDAAAMLGLRDLSIEAMALAKNSAARESIVSTKYEE